MNPPLPSEISAFEPPSPSEFPVTFRGGGMDIFWNHTIVVIIWKPPSRCIVDNYEQFLSGRWCKEIQQVEQAMQDLGRNSAHSAQ